MPHIHSVRSYRKRYCLSQDELADMLGVSQAAVSRLECDNETVTLETAFALQILFDVQPRAVFPNFYEGVEDAVMARAVTLDHALSGKSDLDSMSKHELLAGMIKRAKPIIARL